MLCVAQVYMLVELMLEVYVAHIDGITARHMLRTDPWFQLACFVLLCNWICIIQPQQLQQAAHSSKLQKFFSVGRVLRIVRHRLRCSRVSCEARW